MGKHSKASTAPKACLGLGRLEGGHGEALDVRNCREVGGRRGFGAKVLQAAPKCPAPFLPRGSPCLSASTPRWGERADRHPRWLQALRDSGYRTPANGQAHAGFLIHQRLRRCGPSQGVLVASFLLFFCLCCVFHQVLAQVGK